MEELLENFLQTRETDEFTFLEFVAYCGQRVTPERAREMLEDHPFTVEQSNGAWEILPEDE